MNNQIDLKQVDSFCFRVVEPFLFRYTFWKPSHFRTDLESHSDTANWRTFRFGTAVCGVRTEMHGKSIIADVFPIATGVRILRIVSDSVCNKVTDLTRT